MSVVIRLSRAGRIHLPFYHIGVFDSRTRRDGRPIEQVGFYDPESKSEKSRIDLEKVKAWLAKGAKPSITVGTLLKEKGLTSDLWTTPRKKPTKPKQRTADKKAEAKKARSVKKRTKARTANSKTRFEKKAAAK